MNLKKAIAMTLISVSLLGNTAFASDDYNSQVITNQSQIQQSDNDQNKQLSKQAFSKQKVDTETFSGYFIQDQLSDFQVFAGTIIPGILITGLNSDLPGQVIGQVSENVYDTTTGRYLLIPQGTKILGKYDSQTTFGQNRALVIWNRLIFPNGKSILLGNMQGSDTEGYSGFKDKVNSHYGRAIWSAILGGAITGAVASVTSSGSDDQSFKAQAGSKAAENISSATNSMTQKNLSIQPTILIRPGYQFNIIVDKDLVLEPYEDSAL
jgi:type IV secretion system protein VirB10